VRPQTLGRRIIPEFVVPVAPHPVIFEELSGSPKFPGNPRDHSPCSPTPVGPDPRERTPCQRIRHGPRIRRRRRLTTSRISGLNHTAFGLAVYASQWKLPATTQDSLPVAGPQALPDGIRTRRVPMRGLDHEHLLLSRVSWRNFVSFAWQYLGSSAIRPRATPNAGPLDHTGVLLYRLLPSRSSSKNCQDLPSSRGTLVIIRPALGPRGTEPMGLDPTLTGSAWLPHTKKTEACHELVFRGSITRRLVSLSTPRSGSCPPPRKTYFRLLVHKLYRTGFAPTGFLRKV
jgi:hypothetical protein